MAKGDWHPDSSMRLETVNLQFEAAGKLRHIGIGYHVQLPSGAMAASKGFTWEPPSNQRRALQKVCDSLIQAALDNEGITALAPPASGPPTP